MASTGNLDVILKEILAAMNRNKSSPSGQSSSGCSSSKPSGSSILDNLPITPSQAPAVIGILGGVPDVDSVLADRSQGVEIVLVGSLRQKHKSDTDTLWDQLGAVPFDEVAKAIAGRLV